jgi:hypothetical protein
MSNEEIEKRIERLRETERVHNKEADLLDKENKKLAYIIKQNEIRLKDLRYKISQDKKYMNELINKLPPKIKKNSEKKTKLVIPRGYSIITILNKDI